MDFHFLDGTKHKNGFLSFITHSRKRAYISNSNDEKVFSTSYLPPEILTCKVIESFCDMIDLIELNRLHLKFWS